MELQPQLMTLPIAETEALEGAVPVNTSKLFRIILQKFLPETGVFLLAAVGVLDQVLT